MNKLRDKVIKHTFTDEFVRDEDCVVHMSHCGEWIDSQDVIAIDILFEEDEIEDCEKCKIKKKGLTKVSPFLY